MQEIYICGPGVLTLKRNFIQECFWWLDVGVAQIQIRVYKVWLQFVFQRYLRE